MDCDIGTLLNQVGHRSSSAGRSLGALRTYDVRSSVTRTAHHQQASHTADTPLFATAQPLWYAGSVSRVDVSLAEGGPAVTGSRALEGAIEWLSVSVYTVPTD